ncbi:MAG: oligosaccharide flippase family protein [Geminicoccaceae bacterium]|nr:oligosaccharide flippase family protein [Geminicoccaceae bacterium]
MRSTGNKAKSGPALAGNMAAVLVGRILTIAIGFAAIALLTRHLGPEGYGHYRTVLTLAGIGAILADLGLQFVVLRRISDPSMDSAATLGAGATLRLIATTTIMVAVALLSRLLPYDSIVLNGMVIAAPYFVLFQTCMLLQAVFQKHLRQDLQMLAETGGGLVMLAGVWLAVRAEGGVGAMLLAMVAGGVVQLSLVWWLAARLEPFRPTLDPQQWRDMLRAGLPLAGSRLALMVILRGDILILSLLGSAAAVGLYGVPSKVFEILSGMSTLFAGMLMPMLVAALSCHDTRATGRLLTDAVDTMLIFGGGVLIGFLAFGREILALLAGDAFAAAYPALCLIGVAITANACGQIFRHMLVAMDQQKQAMRVDITLLAIAVPTYMALVPWLAQTGAALATAAIETGLAIGLGRTALASGHFALTDSRIARIALSAALGWLSMIAGTSMGLHWLVAGVLGGGLYLGCLFVLRAVPMALLSSRRS